MDANTCEYIERLINQWDASILNDNRYVQCIFSEIINGLIQVPDPDKFFQELVFELLRITTLNVQNDFYIRCCRTKTINLDKIKFMVDNGFDPQVNKAFVESCMNGYIDNAIYFINMGADVNDTKLLVNLINMQCRQELVDLIVDSGISLNQDIFNAAIYANHIGLVRKCLEQGITINYDSIRSMLFRNDKGLTDMLELLLSYHNINQVTDYAAEFITNNSHMIESVSLIIFSQSLIKFGFDLNDFFAKIVPIKN